MVIKHGQLLGCRPPSTRSAEEVIPIILELLPIKSVCEVGFAGGAWLPVFSKHHVPDVLGIDIRNSPFDSLLIPQSSLLAADRRRPLDLPRTFDLAVSLEIAEHLPAANAQSFVQTLTRVAPVVLFSAAVPNQGGTNHINEQWPEYWECLFNVEGYVAVDAVRPRIWENDDIEWWYRQNTLIYVRETALPDYPLLQAVALQRRWPRRLVHPIMFERMMNRPGPLTGIATAIFRNVKAQLHPRKDLGGLRVAANGSSTRYRLTGRHR